MAYISNKNNSARKKYLFFHFPLKKDDQEVIDSDLKSPEFIEFKNDSGENLFIPEKYSADKSFEIIEERISDSMIGKLKRRNHYLGIAASIAILFVFSFMFIKQQLSEQDVRIILASTGHGERLEVRLPDSSTVILNSLSSLSYPEKFTKDTREVTLTGEGYFSITKDATKPFRVNTDDINVQVLGTIFNIKAYNNEKLIETALLEGSIAIAINNGKQIIMSPGEIALYDRTNKSLNIKTANLSDISSWKENQFVFEDCPLQEICKILEREKDISIIIEDESLKNFRMTAKFIHGEKPREMLEVLGNSGNFSCLRKDKSYYINSNETKINE